MAGCIEPDMFSDDVRFWTRITRFALPEKHGQLRRRSRFARTGRRMQGAATRNLRRAGERDAENLGGIPAMTCALHPAIRVSEIFGPTIQGEGML